jgi:hypothetical protein
MFMYLTVHNFAQACHCKWLRSTHTLCDQPWEAELPSISAAKYWRHYQEANQDTCLVANGTGQLLWQINFATSGRIQGFQCAGSCRRRCSITPANTVCHGKWIRNAGYEFSHLFHPTLTYQIADYAHNTIKTQKHKCGINH